MLVALVALAALAPATAQPRLQLFAALDPDVAAVGAPLRLEVTVYATVPARALPSALMAALGRAVEAGVFTEPLDGLTLVRAEPVETSEAAAEGGRRVVRATCRLVLRPERPGALRVPPFRVALGASSARSPAYAVEGYAVEPAFFAALPGVVPILAEHRADGRAYTRTGTAFFVAPDRLVTSLHVVLDARRVRVQLGDGREVATRHAWAVDAARDVAVLYVDPDDTAGRPLLALAAGPPQDQRVLFTAGWPAGRQRTTAGRHYADLAFFPGDTTWVTANPVRPGDSGGPLLDAQGGVLGVVTAGAALPRHADVLSTEMTVATDPRPALRAGWAADRPRRLHRLVRRAIHDDPDGAVLRIASHLADRRTGANLRAARTVLDDALARYPDDVRLRFMEGVFHRTVGADGEAEMAFRRALALEDTYFPAAYLLGLHLLDRRAYDAATSRFEEARRAPPYEALSVFGLAQVALRRLDYAAARGHLRTLVAERPAYAPGLFALALTHLALGDEDAAREVSVHLRGLDARWAAQLRQVLRRPALRPLVRVTLPPVEPRLLPPVTPSPMLRHGRAPVEFGDPPSDIPRCPLQLLQYGGRHASCLLFHRRRALLCSF